MDAKQNLQHPLLWVLEVKDSTGSLLFYCALWGAVSAGGARLECYL
jgi:hypothetical protein